MENPEFRRLLAVESLLAGAGELIARLMAEQSVTKAELARRLGKSRAWVTQLLNGRANMTVRTLAEVVHALGAEVKLHAQPQGWKMAGELSRATSKPVAFRIRDYPFPSPVHAEDFFRLPPRPATRTQGEPGSMSESEGAGRTRYAA